MKLKTLLSLYHTIGALTPIHADCGELCSAKCCDGEASDGMLCLPGEEKLLRLSPGMTFGRTRNGRCYVACKGYCIRFARPLFCRIYPLVPVLDNGRIRVELDPRATYTCPLLMAPEMIDPAFKRAVCRVGHILFSDAEGKAFLEDLSQEIKEYRRFIK